MKTDGGGWTVIQRREKGGMLDFFRNWAEYENGFGYFDHEFWLGLSKIHRLTQHSNYSNTLRVEIQHAYSLNSKYAKYSTFHIGGCSEMYAIHVGSYSPSSTTTDGLSYHNGQKFSTRDYDNDMSEDNNCANFWKAAWWYNRCYYSNLNGERLWRGSNTLTWNSNLVESDEMKLRRNNN